MLPFWSGLPLILKISRRAQSSFDGREPIPASQRRLLTALWRTHAGESFHFASRLKTETLRESIYRHEHFLALKLGLKAEHKARLCFWQATLPRLTAARRGAAGSLWPYAVASAAVCCAWVDASALRSHLSLWIAPQVLDVGCGVGGPLRSISAFSGAAVVGLNNNDYQVRP